MKEIERIIRDVKKGTLHCLDATKAIEEYAIKARIESVSKVMGMRSWELASEYAEELNKKLK